MIFHQFQNITLFFLNSCISIIGIFYSSSEPISPYLLRCKGFAVENHSFILHASHLRQTRLVNNPGYSLS
ncbi:MAG: hypothetical protein WBC20_07090, partial [Candidatus Aminicenantaceae bacterium]